MTVHELAGLSQLTTAVLEEDRTVSRVFCCDMLSIAMAKAPSDSVWVTVMGNRNVIAVATLADVSCVVLAEGFDYDAEALEAAEGRVTLLKCPLPVFETASLIHQEL